MARKYALSPVQHQPVHLNPVKGLPALDDIIDDFLLHYAGRELGTRRFWEDQVGRAFRGFLREAGVTALEEIDATLLRRYMARESDPKRKPRPLGPKSRVHRYSGIFRLLEWCVEQGYRADNPAQLVDRPREPKTIRPGYSQPELQRMLRFVHHDAHKRDWIGVRNHTILIVLLDTGARADELLAMTTDRLNLGAGEVLLMGKGRKERISQLGRVAKDALNHWLDVRPLVPLDALWVNLYGEPLGYQALRDMLNDLEGYSGVENIEAHRFRHTFARAHYEKNRDMLALRDALGHTEIATTERYLRSLGFNFNTQARHPSPADWLAVDDGRAPLRVVRGRG